MGIDRETTTFYLVTPYIWAYDNQGMSIPKWEADHNKDWKDVYVYDAAKLRDWINSEPSVCAWLLEQYGDKQLLSFSSVADAWKTFSNRTDPPFLSTMFLEGQQDEINVLKNRMQQKMCRVRAATFLDAYGFCLAILMQNKETMNHTIVVHDKNTYYELTRTIKGKTLLLSFPFIEQVSDTNHTINCYSKETTYRADMIKLHDRWKSQFTKALREMGLSDVKANECYSFTHGNLLSLIRRIPGNTADSTPNWVNSINKDLLYPIVFLKQFSIESEIEKRIVTFIADVEFDTIVKEYEQFGKMEDAPLKKLDGVFYLVSYEEAWWTLNIDISDVMSKRMYEIIRSILSECESLNEFESRMYAPIMKRLFGNYIYFAETGSDQTLIDEQVKSILKYANSSKYNQIVIDSLSNLAEASPDVVLDFIKAELDQGIVFELFTNADRFGDDYCIILWALDKLVNRERTAIQACMVLSNLCHIRKEYHINNSPRESLLDALCLWNNYCALTIHEKTQFTIKLIEGNHSFGIPFAINLVAKDSLVRGVRIGAKECKYPPATHEELYTACHELTSKIINISINDNQMDWLNKILEIYWYVPCEVLSNSAEVLSSIEKSAEQLIPLIFQLHYTIYNIKKHFQDRNPWIDPLNKWLNYLITDDPISKDGWKFYKFYQTPFDELLQEPNIKYFEKQAIAKNLRKETLSRILKENGISTVIRLTSCMEDERDWGEFLGTELSDNDCIIIAKSIDFSEKINIVTGLIDTVTVSVAKQLFNNLSLDEQKSIIPLLYRNDIDEWLSSSELEYLYWHAKQIKTYDERSYHFLLKYNPCGILPIFIYSENDPDNFNRLTEIVRAIIILGNCTNPGLLTHAIRQFDNLYYSDEWAELCLELYNKGLLKDLYSYYPDCLKNYFFKHPERIIESFQTDPIRAYKHFKYYSLPLVAYEDQAAFMKWSDYMYEKTIECTLLDLLGSIFGRTCKGRDGFFPHESVRIALEKYSDTELTQAVASGRTYSRGAHFVSDGYNEMQSEEEYRRHARSIKIEYPQTANLLEIIADYFGSDSKMDRKIAESYPQ